MRALKIYDRLKQHTQRELDQTQREIEEIDQGLRQLPDFVTLAEELDRLYRYREYLLDDLRHIREKRDSALKILRERPNGSDPKDNERREVAKRS